MSIEQQITNNPPRSITIPQLPQPQTCFGVLEHTGIPYSDPENVTDIPPDFSWMTETHALVKSFIYSTQDEIGKKLSDWAAHAPDMQDVTTPDDESHPMTWQRLPFYVSKWWTGMVSYRFLAIMPSRVTGKILIRYTFENNVKNSPAIDPKQYDTLYRGIIKEWDLGQSNIFEFDIPALDPIQARPTWLPETKGFPLQVAGTLKKPWINYQAYQQINPSTWMLGRITCETAQNLSPGSIFPDSIRILVFRIFKNSTFYQPTDPRQSGPHALSQALARWPMFSTATGT